MASTPFPYAPCIEIFGPTEISDPDPLDTEWRFSIDGRTRGICGSAQDAAEAAERDLFENHGDLVEKHIHLFLKDGKTALALQLVERRGFHAGVVQERSWIHAAIAPSVHALNNELSRGARRGFGSR